MARDTSEDEQGDTGTGDPEEARIVRRTIAPDPETPYFALLEIVAEIEGCEVEALPPLYERTDHLLEKLFDDPPSQKAQVELSFSYHGYRITMDQLGNVTLRKLVDDIDVGE